MEEEEETSAWALPLPFGSIFLPSPAIQTILLCTNLSVLLNPVWFRCIHYVVRLHPVFRFHQQSALSRRPFYLHVDLSFLRPTDFSVPIFPLLFCFEPHSSFSLTNDVFMFLFPSLHNLANLNSYLSFPFVCFVIRWATIADWLQEHKAQRKAEEERLHTGFFWIQTEEAGQRKRTIKLSWASSSIPR